MRIPNTKLAGELYEQVEGWNMLIEPHWIKRFQFPSQAAALAVIALSCLVLIGWRLDMETLKTVFPGGP